VDSHSLTTNHTFGGEDKEDNTYGGEDSVMREYMMNIHHMYSDQRKIPLQLFTIGFQKPGIFTDSWFQKSNGKKVKWDFSLIILSLQENILMNS
jgi:hypothetical protein